jgi:DNA repair protein RadA/Sms
MQIKTQVNGVKLGTDILKLKVPDQLRMRRSLGLGWLNTALGGKGMTPSTVMMLTGSPGFGKSTLLRQLADSITGEGHIALYNTGEESLYQVKMRVEEMGLERGFKVGQENFIGKVLGYARELQRDNPKKQVFILQDSLQTLNDGYYKDGGTTSATPVRCCEQLTDWAKETYGICIFIGQVTKDGKFAGKNTIKHAVDVHAELIRDDDKDSPTRGQRVFTVSKNRFGPDGLTFPYGLNEKGIYVQDMELPSPTRGDDEEDMGAADEAASPKRTQSGVVAKAGTTTQEIAI